jgi:hypothetical protein
MRYLVRVVDRQNKEIWLQLSIYPKRYDQSDVHSKLELVQANISTKSCSCEEDIESLKSTVLDLQCRSMKNNLIFTGLHEVSNEYTVTSRLVKDDNTFFKPSN